MRESQHNLLQKGGGKIHALGGGGGRKHPEFIPVLTGEHYSPDFRWPIAGGGGWEVVGKEPNLEPLLRNAILLRRLQGERENGN